MGITDVERVLQIVGDLDHLLVGVRDPVLREVRLAREQWQVLRLLADGQGHPMGEISSAVGLAGATATRTVDALAQRMLVYRRHDSLDRRKILIYISEPGQETLDQVNEVMLEHAGPLFSEFDAAERTALLQLLARLAASSAARPGARLRSA